MIKVLYFVNNSDSALDLIKNIDKDKFRPIIYKTELDQPFSIISIPNFSILTYKKLKGIIIQTNPDIIHSFDPSIIFYLLLIRKTISKPFIIGIEKSNSIKYIYQHLAYSLFVDQIISEFDIAQDIEKKKIIKKSKLYIANKGVDTIKYRPIKNKTNSKKKYSISHSTKVITVYLNCDNQKEVKNILLSLEKITFSKIKTNIFLVSNSDLKSPLPNNKFKFASKTNFPSLLAISDIFISFDQKLENKYYLEAASYGLPILSVDNIIARKLIKENKNGYLIKKNDSIKLTNQIIDLTKNTKKRHSFGRYSRKLILKYFDRSTYIKDIQKLYEDLLKKKVSQQQGASSGQTPRRRYIESAV